MITKSGARTGLVTTRGFRDVLELRRHNSAELYDILWDPPEPLVPRRRRLEVTERVDYAGAVVAALDEQELETALDRLRDHEIESLAVCFLHSYANPLHERRVQEIVAARWPELYVSISSDLLREPQEFERTATTVVQRVPRADPGALRRAARAAASGEWIRGPAAGHALGRRAAAGSVHPGGAGAHAHVGPGGGCDGGAGFRLVRLSAAGAMAAEAVAADTGFRQLISLDIGGTSADIAVIRDGRTLLVNEYSPEFGLPIRFPAVDLLTIGAGGGSIAWVDAAATPQVGPQSAGARPGPACYGARRHRANGHRCESRARPPLAGDAARRRAPAAPRAGRRRRRPLRRGDRAELGRGRARNHRDR